MSTLTSEAFSEAQEVSRADLATKSDLKDLELKINAQSMLLKWMMGFILAGMISLILKASYIS